MVKKTILIPPDESIRQALEHSFLHRGAFEIITANSGEEAMKIIEESDPVLAILDLDMEGLSGDACCREVKQDPFLSDTPMALIATSAHPSLLERCQTSGCDAILVKPIDTRELLTTLCQMLEIKLRGEPRVEVSLAAHLQLEGKCPHTVQVIDLNHGGFFVQSPWLQPVGTRLELTLLRPEITDVLRCEVEVVWVNHPEWLKAHRLPTGMGIRFIDPEDPFTKVIEELYTSGAPPA